jgi:arabinofuranosyltransferase
MDTRDELFNRKHETIYLALILFLALLFYALFIYRTAFPVGNKAYFTLVDDAMISMRYARNFSNGFGLVWNVGQPAVEGFTNLGWTLYLALLHCFPVPESKISLLVMMTSAFLLSGTAFLSFKISKVIAPRSEIAPLVAATITAFYFPLVFWSLRGMEVALVTFLIYASVLLAIHPAKPTATRRALPIGLLLLLAILVRFDAILQVTLLLAYILYEQVLKRRANFVHISPILLFYLAGTIGVLLFQYRYYGFIFPNTFYHKLEGVTLLERVFVGLQVFVEYASRDFLAPLFIFFAGLLLFHDLRKKECFLLLALFVVQCLYSIFIGGDYAEPLNAPEVDAANRFITQGMPSVIVLFAVAIDRFAHSFESLYAKTIRGIRMSEILVTGISLASLIIMSGEPWFKWGLYNAPLLDSDIWRTRLGVLIKNNTGNDVVIAAHAAGQIPYYANRQTIDLLGLSDPIIARGSPATSFQPGHNKWNYVYSISMLKPDLIADNGWFLSDFLADKPEYARLINGIWIRRDCNSINIDGLSQPYW